MSQEPKNGDLVPLGGTKAIIYQIKAYTSRFWKCVIARWAWSLKAVTWPTMLRNRQFHEKNYYSEKHSLQYIKLKLITRGFQKYMIFGWACHLSDVTWPRMLCICQFHGKTYQIRYYMLQIKETGHIIYQIKAYHEKISKMYDSMLGVSTECYHVT